jgi:hypothetical protein
MPFRIITGTMGSGKSYMGAEICMQVWRENGVVHTNIDLIPEEVERHGWTENCVMLGDDPTEWIPKIRRGAEGAENLVVVDEGMLLFNSHDWQTTQKKHRQLLEFLVWSRKMGLDVYFIGQAQKGMDVAFTRLALQVCACSAVKEYPLIGPIMSQLRGDFRRLWKYPTGQKTGEVTYHRFKPEVGAIYKTESTHGKFEALDKQVTRVKGGVDAGRKKSWAVVAAVFAVLGGAIWFVQHAIGRVLGGGRDQASQAENPAPVTVARVTDPEPVAARPVEKPASAPRFRVWGVSDLGRLRFWEAKTGILCELGAIYDDAVVVAVSMSERIYKLRLDDGRVVHFRPAARADYPPPQPTRNSDQSWKPKSSPFTSLPFGSSGALP